MRPDLSNLTPQQIAALTPEQIAQMQQNNTASNTGQISTYNNSGGTYNPSQIQNYMDPHYQPTQSPSTTPPPQDTGLPLPPPVVTPPAGNPPAPTNPTGGNPSAGNATIVPGQPQGPDEIGIVQAAGQIATDPSLILGPESTLSDNLPGFTQQQIQSGMQNNVGPLGQAPVASTAQGTAATAAGTTQGATNTYDATTTADQVAAADMQAAQGTLSDGSIIDPNTVGNEQLSQQTQDALGQAAQQNMSNIIDTTTLAGKLIAQALGEGNYTDSKATIKGQLDILQGEFFDPATGEPKIPSWAAATARNVSKIAAFKGMTGTAATAAMAQALMEASLPIAQQDAQFFQTLTIKNLDNRQEATINKANVLAKMDMQNADARLSVAINNAQAFLKMDMQNLDNRQQAAVINHQSRVQSILEDAKAENVAKQFNAESQNEMDMYYDQLQSQIDQFNAAQKNGMTQFNVSEKNDMSQFNANMLDQRNRFYHEMQFQVDKANAEWRRTVTLTENQQAFEAAATDVKNRVGVSVEMLNQLWDRSDALLDYAWKTADNTAERNNRIAIAKLQGEMALEAADREGTGEILGTLLGTGASFFFDWLF